MLQHKFCQKCDYKTDCRHIYEKLGSSKGHSVVKQVTLAFLLPIVAFIIFLGGFVKLLEKTIYPENIQVCIGFLLALSATFVLILIVKLINRLMTKNKIS